MAPAGSSTSHPTRTSRAIDSSARARATNDPPNLCGALTSRGNKTRRTAVKTCTSRRQSSPNSGAETRVSTAGSAPAGRTRATRTCARAASHQTGGHRAVRAGRLGTKTLSGCSCSPCCTRWHSSGSRTDRHSRVANSTQRTRASTSRLPLSYSAPLQR